MADIRRGPTAEQRRSESGFEVRPGLPPGRRRAGPGRPARRAGGAPVHPRRLPDHVHRPALDDAPVRRLRHRPGVERALSPAAARRHHRAVGRLRPADPDGLRLRRPGRARRGRQGRRRDRLGRRHAAALRRDPPRRRLDLHDDQLARGVAAAALPARGRGAGRRRRQDQRHDPERRAQGVRRPRHLHLPAGAVAPAGHGHLLVLPRRDPPLEHHLDLRLPHGRGRRDARSRRSPSPSPTASSTSAPRSGPGSPSTTSPRGWRSSSSPGPPCWRRSRSSGRRGGSGPGSCATSSVRRTRSRRCCASTPRPPGCS